MTRLGRGQEHLQCRMWREPGRAKCRHGTCLAESGFNEKGSHLGCKVVKVDDEMLYRGDLKGAVWG